MITLWCVLLNIFIWESSLTQKCPFHPTLIELPPKQHDLYKCSADTKCVAYTIGYGPAVWGPYLYKDILNIEMVQRGVACWVKSDYGYNTSSVSSISSMLSNLQWPTLQHR